MFNVKDEKVKALLLNGNFGLEKESLRITPEGHMAHTPNPFPGNEHIVRDFVKIRQRSIHRCCPLLRMQ